mmetsp:Transcript_96484/g.268131  ORF Transcript_96484/g.268131 Transcript_96484/m.268131 type:complete len:220 (-) Transcript_96484:45-704(-)
MRGTSACFDSIAGTNSLGGSPKAGLWSPKTPTPTAPYVTLPCSPPTNGSSTTPATGRSRTAMPMRTHTCCRLPRTNSMVPSSGSTHKHVSVMVSDSASSAGTSKASANGNTSANGVATSCRLACVSSSSPTSRMPGNMPRRLLTMASCDLMSATVRTSAGSIACAARSSPSIFLLWAPSCPCWCTSRMMLPPRRAKWTHADSNVLRSRRAAAAIALPGS